MKVFIVVEDETNYNGARRFIGVTSDFEKADALCRAKRAEPQSRPEWTPDYYIEESVSLD